ncbi:MAG: hypothetical protein LBR72_06810 [Oscillospiraceae bacterium]|nr:hypothetical protein [Oscillospiraceae bacterium]
MRTRLVAVYSAAHFTVDFTCAFVMLRVISGGSAHALCFLLYNFCAFAMQAPLGVLADRLNRNRLFATCGLLLTALAGALAFAPGLAIAASALLGIGNGAFHVGGGIDVMNFQKLGALGVFVSPGAFGIYLGALLGQGNAFPVLSALLLPFLAAIAVFVFCRDGVRNTPFSLSGLSLSRMTLAAGLFLAVCLRSYLGFAADFPRAGAWGIVLVCAVAAGKASGGFIAEKLGLPQTGIAAALAAAALLLLPYHAAGIGAAFLINLTMPLTLGGMARLFPNAKGFAFGALTLALFIGTLPVL